MDRAAVWSTEDQTRLLLSILRPHLGVPASTKIAPELIGRFGSLPAALNARRTQLMSLDGMSEEVVELLVAVRELSTKIARERVIRAGAVLSSSSAVMDYLNATMAHLPVEHLRILFLNKRNHLIADEIMQRGTVDHTPCYTREIVKRALEHSATAMIIAHNHPSGDPAPSASDVRTTNEIIAAARLFDIAVHDHVVVGHDRQISLRSMQLI